MLSNSSSAQGEGAVRWRDHSSFVVTPEKKKEARFIANGFKNWEWRICWHAKDTYHTYNMVQVQQFEPQPQAHPLLFCPAQSDRSAHPTGCTPASSQRSLGIADGHMALSSAQRPSGGLFGNQFESGEEETSILLWDHHLHAGLLNNY